MDIFIALDDVIGGEHQVGGDGNTAGGEALAGIDQQGGSAGFFDGGDHGFGKLMQRVIFCGHVRFLQKIQVSKMLPVYPAAHPGASPIRPGWRLDIWAGMEL